MHPRIYLQKMFVISSRISEYIYKKEYFLFWLICHCLKKRIRIRYISTFGLPDIRAKWTCIAIYSIILDILLNNDESVSVNSLYSSVLIVMVNRTRYPETTYFAGWLVNFTCIERGCSLYSVHLEVECVLYIPKFNINLDIWHHARCWSYFGYRILPGKK